MKKKMFFKKDILGVSFWIIGRHFSNDNKLEIFRVLSEVKLPNIRKFNLIHHMHNLGYKYFEIDNDVLTSILKVREVNDKLAFDLMNKEFEKYDKNILY